MEIFKLFGRIVLDANGANEEIEETTGRASKLADTIKNGLGAAAKVGAAAVAAAATGAAALVKSSVEAYAEYEQLVGGIDTLFKDSNAKVMENAANAFKTAGMSANEYMETVTSFSASLIQSLGGDTEKAAEVADRAITDMSDNANKMGTSIGMIQNAYQGFAKQNYTMLDNLKLGYGGTQEEMKRLLADATAISGIQYDMSSYADVVEAIHVIQTEMGITGTTAAEASGTIQGSVSAAKAAWQNMVTALADENANLEEQIDIFAESAATAAGNILPKVGQALSGLGTVVAKLAPVLVNGLTMLVTDVVPDLLASAASLIATLVQGIMDNLDAIMDAAFEVVMMLIDSIVDMLPEIIEMGIVLLVKLAEGLIKAIPQLVSKIPQIISAIVKGFTSGMSKIRDIGKNIVQGVWQGIQNMGSWIRSKVSDFFSGIVSSVKGLLGIHSPSKVFAGIGKNMAAGLGEGWNDEFSDIKGNINDGLNFDANGTVSYGANGVGGSNGDASGVFSTSYIGGTLDVVEGYLAAILERLNFNIVLDDGVLVGRLAPAMSDELGRLAVMKGRGM